MRAELHGVDAKDAPAGSVLERVFSEAIRLMPPLWLVDRKTTEDVQLRNHVAPAGTNVITSPYVTHRDARFWRNPETFDPDRFLDEHAKDRPKYAYFPFGGGRMRCIGVGLAQLQMKAIAKHVLGRCRLVPLIGHSFEVEPLLG
ncbi:MAG: cytochrome P450 [Aquisalimonadaceae bacterium]